jgi:hypothetical protein
MTFILINNVILQLERLDAIKCPPEGYTIAVTSSGAQIQIGEQMNGDALVDRLNAEAREARDAREIQDARGGR